MRDNTKHGALDRTRPPALNLQPIAYSLQPTAYSL